MATKKQKMTDEERHALAEELKVNVNHRCQAVACGGAEWVNGYIAGVIEDKRCNTVLYAIKTDDNHRIVKVYDSRLIRIFDEISMVKKETTRTANDIRFDRIKWTPEVIAEEVNKYIDNVGKTVKVEVNRTIDTNGNECINTIKGRITAIAPEKRTQRIFYNISISNKTDTWIVKKAVTSEELQIAEEFDAEGRELNTAYRERRRVALLRFFSAPQDRILNCEQNLKNAEEKLQKAVEELEFKKQQLEEAKGEFDTYLTNQSESK